MPIATKKELDKPTIINPTIPIRLPIIPNVFGFILLLLEIMPAD